MTIHPFELADGSPHTHIVGSRYTRSKGSLLKNRRRSGSALLVLATLFYACSDSSGPPGGVGPLAQLAVQGNTQTALAGTPLPTAIIIVPQDENGRTVVDQTATFTVVAGGGTLSSSTGQTNPDGTITAPTWTLGKSDVPQELRVDVAGKTSTITASVQTAYNLEVRFYGANVSTANKAIFTNAAARIRGLLVGGLPSENVTGLDPTECTGPGVATLSGSVSGLLIFASVDTIDGPGKILGQAGPCYVRGTDANPDFRTLIGVMKFDDDDFANLAGSGGLQAVITHEMLHVVGLGTLWPYVDLLVNSGTGEAAYTGPSGIAGCRALGFTNTCANTVPVEDCEDLVPADTPCGAGQREGHWKESVFQRELMTPFISSGTNPLSVMTIRSLQDFGYVVNPAAADPFSVATGSVSAFGGFASTPMLAAGWERPLKFKPRVLPRAGSPERTGN
jgi:hypothetical protein